MARSTYFPAPCRQCQAVKIQIERTFTFHDWARGNTNDGWRWLCREQGCILRTQAWVIMVVRGLGSSQSQLLDWFCRHMVCRVLEPTSISLWSCISSMSSRSTWWSELTSMSTGADFAVVRGLRAHAGTHVGKCRRAGQSRASRCPSPLVKMDITEVSKSTPPVSLFP